MQACNASPQLDLETRVYRVEGCVHFETDGRFSRVACGGPCGGFQSHLATCNITLHRIVTYYSTVTAPAGDYSTDRTHSRDRFLFPSPCQRIARNPDCGSIWWKFHHPPWIRCVCNGGLSNNWSWIFWRESGFLATKSDTSTGFGIWIWRMAALNH